MPSELDATRSGTVVGASAVLLAVLALACFAAIGPGPAMGAAARGYEMVSPPDKADVDLDPAAFSRVAVDGSRLYFRAQGVFVDSTASSDNNYLAVRGSTAWATRSLDPPLFGNNGLSFQGFSMDLARGAFTSQLDFPELVPGDPPGVSDLYLRNNLSDSSLPGTYSLVTTQVPVEGGSVPRLSWASSDLGHLLFSVPNGRLFVPDGPQQGAYYATDVSGSMSLVSLVPDESTPASDDETPAPAALPGAGAGSGIGSTNAISEDGSVAYFTASKDASGLGLNDPTRPSWGVQLYVRVNHGEPNARTVHISAPEPGATEPSGLTLAAWFRAATPDGSRVFFTSCQRLTTDATTEVIETVADACDPDFPEFSEDFATESDLYLFDLTANGGAGDLVDLTTTDPSGANVLGFVGASDDGSRAYFVARGDLADGATAGQSNLYAWVEGAGVRHIATLDPADSDVWRDAGFPAKESRVTPDGRHLLFASEAPLAPGFDNAGHSEVYLYDLTAGELTCVSCAGRGAASADARIGQDESFDGYSQRFEKRNLLPDGSLAFFETAEALVPQDVNGVVDVYEYSATTGAVKLISSGQDDRPSRFIGASVTGDDVFFATRERLVGWDVDGLVDYYDARVGGGFPEPEAGTGGCGLDCQGLPPGPPGLRTPGSSLAETPGIAPGKRHKVSLHRLSARQRAKAVRTGRLPLRISVNRAGTLKVEAVARLEQRKRVVAQRRKRVTRASTARVMLRLSKPARRHLTAAGRLRLSIAVHFGGAAERQVVLLRVANATSGGSR